jgi:leader peptidase (prepilin peptidase)/N-methyltransferase
MTAAYAACLVSVFLAGTVFGRWLNRCIRKLPFRETFGGCWEGCVVDAVRDLRVRQVWWRHLPIVGWYRATGLSPAECRRRAGIELLTGLLLATLYVVEVTTWSATPLTSSMTAHYGSPLTDPANHARAGLVLHLRFLTHAVLILALVVATFVDFDHKIIPDSITLPGAILGLAAQVAFGCVWLVPVWYQEPRALGLTDVVAWTLFSVDGVPDPAWREWLISLQGVPAWTSAWPIAHALTVALAGGVAGAGVIWGVRIVGFRALGQEAMGFGDVTLMGMIGLYLGWQPVVAVFVYAPMIALVVAGVQWLLNGQHELPFGPYLSASTLLILLGWPWFYPPVEGMLSFFGPLLPLVFVGMLAALWGLLSGWRLVKRLLGWSDYLTDDEVEWSSADQLLFLAGEHADERRGRWSDAGIVESAWRGCDVGRGLGLERDWRGD